MRCVSALPAALLLAVGAPAQAAPLATAAEWMENWWSYRTTDGAAEIFVREIGAGPEVVFLHGGPGNNFLYALPLLEPHRSHHRFILFDQRGSLLSPVAAQRRSTLTIDQLVADLEQLRVARNLPRLRLVGHSFGSLLALEYLRQHPDRVASITLTGAFPVAQPGGTRALVADMRPRQRQLLGQTAEIDATLRRAGLPLDPRSDTPVQASDRWRITQFAPIVVRNLSRWRQAIGGGVFYSSETDDRIAETIPADLDFRAAVAASGLPVTIIQGSDDYIDPGASRWHNFARYCASVTVTTIPNAVHNAWLDDPAGFARAFAIGLSRRGPGDRGYTPTRCDANAPVV